MLSAETKTYDPEAEAALLGALCLEPHRILPIALLLGPGGRGVFGEKRNDDLFEILVKMAGEGEAIDVITVQHRMRIEEKFQAIGGRERLVELAQSVTSGAHARYHAGIVKNFAILRRLAATGTDIARRAPEIAPRDEEITEFTAEVEDAIRSDFGRVSSSDGPQHASDIFRAISSRSIDAAAQARDGIKTGLYDIDALIGGFTAGQLVTIGARTGGGKTSLAMQTVSRTLRTEGNVVLYFSMEMTREELCLRIVAQETGIPMKRLSTKELSDKEWASVDESVGRRERENFIVDETAHPTVGQVMASGERIKARFGRLDLLVCDGLQLMHAKAENRSQEIGKITRGLKSLAKELRCPIVTTTQLNRGEGQTQNRLPGLRDIKESSSIEQDSDIVILLWRPDGSDPNEPPTSAKANIAKHRNGPTGLELLSWSPNHMTFRDAAPRATVMM